MHIFDQGDLQSGLDFESLCLSGFPGSLAGKKPFFHLHLGWCFAPSKSWGHPDCPVLYIAPPLVYTQNLEKPQNAAKAATVFFH